MELLLLEETVWARLRDTGAGRPGPCLGLYLNESGLSASRVLWDQKSGGKTPRLQPLTFHGQPVYDLVWQGVDDFFVPPSWMGRRCTPEATRREAFTAWFSNAVEALFQTEANGLDTQHPLVAAVRCPEQRAWLTQQDAFRTILQESIPKTLPVVIGLATGSQAVSPRGAGLCLTVHVDKHWTEFTLRDGDGRQLQQTSAALEMPSSSGLAGKPAVLRVNDYRNNCTAIWQEARFPSWLEAFAAVCRDLRQEGWPPADCARLLCASGDFPDLRKALLESGLLNGPAGYVECPADALAELAGQATAERFNTRKRFNAEISEQNPRAKLPKQAPKVKPKGKKPAKPVPPPEEPKAKSVAASPAVRPLKQGDVFRCLDDAYDAAIVPTPPEQNNPFQL